GEDAAEHEKQECSADIEKPDPGVVHRRKQSPPFRRLPDFLEALQLVGRARQRIRQRSCGIASAHSRLSNHTDSARSSRPVYSSLSGIALPGLMSCGPAIHPASVPM